MPGFEAETGARIEALFGAVGALRARLDEGAPCDVLVLTEALIEALRLDGRVDADSIAPLGRVPTGIAVRAGAEAPDIATPAAVRTALLAADAIYFPDPSRATAGKHFAGVLERLGIRDALASRLRVFPNGAIAMARMASGSDAHSIGCTQATEILYTPGVMLVGALPGELALGTVYAVGVASRTTHSGLARRFAASLAGDSAAELRKAGGFAPVA